MTMTEEKTSHAEANAQAWSESIAAAYEAWQHCAEEGEGKYLSREAKAVLKEQGFDGTNHNEVSEWIEDAMRESALSVDIREGWRSPGEGASLEPTEFRILLSTGGPALRISGELNHDEPSRCWLEHQDWGTPWTRFFDQYGEARLWFAGLFWYEG